VFIHHWLITNDRKNAGYTPTQTFIFAVGAETRHAQRLRAPYAYINQPGDKWTGMVHFMNTLYAADVQECVECTRCEAGTPHCCDDGTFCETLDYPEEQGPRSYYLTYSLITVPLSMDLVPVQPYVLDVAKGTVHFDIPQCSAPPCFDARSLVYVVPDDLDVVYMIGHLHLSAVKLTTEVVSRTNEVVLDCTSYPVVGTGDVAEAGNETGYLIDMTPCHFSPKRHVPAGSTFVVTAFYDSREFHGGVMALSIFWAIDYREQAQIRTALETAEEEEEAALDSRRRR